MGGQATFRQACMRIRFHLCAYRDLGEIDIDGIGRIKNACWGQWHVGDRLDLSQTSFAVQPAHKIHSRSHITCTDTSDINLHSLPSQHLLQLLALLISATRLLNRSNTGSANHKRLLRLPHAVSTSRPFTLSKDACQWTRRRGTHCRNTCPRCRNYQVHSYQSRCHPVGFDD